MKNGMFESYEEAWKNRNSSDDATRTFAQRYLNSYKDTHTSGEVKAAKSAAKANENYEWMETSGAFDGWSDEQKAAFITQWSNQGYCAGKCNVAKRNRGHQAE